MTLIYPKKAQISIEVIVKLSTVTVVEITRNYFDMSGAITKDALQDIFQCTGRRGGYFLGRFPATLRSQSRFWAARRPEMMAWPCAKASMSVRMGSGMRRVRDVRDGLGEAVAEVVVGEGSCTRRVGHGDQAAGAVVGVGCDWPVCGWLIHFLMGCFQTRSCFLGRDKRCLCVQQCSPMHNCFGQ